VNVRPFIETERQSEYSVNRACQPLKVSRTAFYARRSLTITAMVSVKAEQAQGISQLGGHGTTAVDPIGLSNAPPT
jgi:hypothetical protein